MHEKRCLPARRDIKGRQYTQSGPGRQGGISRVKRHVVANRMHLNHGLYSTTIASRTTTSRHAGTNGRMQMECRGRFFVNAQSEGLLQAAARAYSGGYMDLRRASAGSLARKRS